jgi:small-conductance mechanosensitive channel
MTAPSISLTNQMLRRRPIVGAPVAHGASDHLKRTIGTFQLTLFGVGATVGTTIGVLTGLGIMAIPGLGPLVAAGWLATAAAGLAAGTPHA